MKMTMHPDMVEATRLTREGRLTEATALLQRMLRSTPEPDARTDGPRAAAASSPLGDTHIIEVPTEMIEPPAPRRSSSRGDVETGSAGDKAEDASFGARSLTPGWLGRLLAKAGRIHAIAPNASTISNFPAADTPNVLPSGGQFLNATFTDQAGTRAYKLYIPSTYQGKPLPLVVMLHGCTQTADDFATGTRMNLVAEERTCFVAYPAQPRSANGSKCWNWFDTGHQQRDRGEPSLIAGITRQISRDYAIDLRRVYIAGLSAGGAAAAIMAATYPDIYAAAGVHSGLACGAASDLPSAFSAMQQGTSGASKRSHRSSGFHGHDRLVPTIVFHGDKDVTVHPRNGHHVIEQFRSSGPGALRSVTQRGRMAGGRTYSRTNHFDASGRAVLELWVVHGAGHAWSGGSPAGSFTDPHGPDASREMIRFFLAHSHPAAKPI
jgi:poly(hydroxyalkanoate) depolymerase family esterase